MHLKHAIWIQRPCCHPKMIDWHIDVLTTNWLTVFYNMSDACVIWILFSLSEVRYSSSLFFWFFIHCDMTKSIADDCTVTAVCKYLTKKTINIVWFLWHFKPNSCLFVKFNMVIDFYYSNAKRYMWTATEENKKKKQKYCIKRGKVNKKKKQKLYLCKREIVF